MQTSGYTVSELRQMSESELLALHSHCSRYIEDALMTERPIVAKQASLILLHQRALSRQAKRDVADRLYAKIEQLEHAIEANAASARGAAVTRHDVEHVLNEEHLYSYYCECALYCRGHLTWESRRHSA
jgi:hypothetical protein